MNNVLNLSENLFYRQLLQDNLKRIFGEFDTTILNRIEKELEWLEILGGETLMNEGDTGDSLYFVLSGRLAAYKTINGEENKLGEIIRGETVGEMAIFTGQPRYATVIAVRDSVLVKLSKSLFEKVIGEFPDVALNVTKLIIERFNNVQSQIKKTSTVNFCFVALNINIDLELFVNKIHAYCSRFFKIGLLDSNVLKQQDFYIHKKEQATYSKELTQWLNNLESMHDFMFLICDSEHSFWNEKCFRHADHIILITDARNDHGKTPIETYFENIVNVNFSLALIHPEDTIIPNNTIKWLSLRPKVNQHFHLRQNKNEDLNRMSRILTGKAIGLVLAGGGAKGFAHIGVFKALEENNIPIDFVGGTSVGSLIASAISFDHPALHTEDIVRKSTYFKPSSDISIFPMISLLNGGNIKKMLSATFERFCGKKDLDIADSWIPMYVVASNYSKAKETIFYRGSMLKCLLASSAIPGVFPPVIINGDLFVDGGSFNNFPADIMRSIGIDKVIGVDFHVDKQYLFTYEELPSNLAIFKNKLFGKKSKKIKLPNLASLIVNSTLLYSTAKRYETKTYLDLHFNPDVSKFGITAWSDYDNIVEKGYLHALEVISKMDPLLKESLQALT